MFFVVDKVKVNAFKQYSGPMRDSYGLRIPRLHAKCAEAQDQTWNTFGEQSVSRTDLPLVVDGITSLSRYKHLPCRFITVSEN